MSIFSKRFKTFVSTEATNFTQVVWRGSTECGLGKALMGNQKKVVVVAFYRPAGNLNLAGQYEDNVQAALHTSVPPQETHLWLSAQPQRAAHTNTYPWARDAGHPKYRNISTLFTAVYLNPLCYLLHSILDNFVRSFITLMV